MKLEQTMLGYWTKLIKQYAESQIWMYNNARLSANKRKSAQELIRTLKNIFSTIYGDSNTENEDINQIYPPTPSGLFFIRTPMLSGSSVVPTPTQSNQLKIPLLRRTSSLSSVGDGVATPLLPRCPSTSPSIDKNLLLLVSMEVDKEIGKIKDFEHDCQHNNPGKYDLILNAIKTNIEKTMLISQSFNLSSRLEYHNARSELLFEVCKLLCIIDLNDLLWSAKLPYKYIPLGIEIKFIGNKEQFITTIYSIMSQMYAGSSDIENLDSADTVAEFEDNCLLNTFKAAKQVIEEFKNAHVPVAYLKQVMAILESLNTQFQNSHLSDDGANSIEDAIKIKDIEQEFSQMVNNILKDEDSTNSTIQLELNQDIIKEVPLSVTVEIEVPEEKKEYLILSIEFVGLDMQVWWKNPRFIGIFAYWVMRCLTATLRIRIVGLELIKSRTPYLFAFWHGNQFLPAESLIKHHHTPMCAMVSPSRDGAMLAVYLEKIGYWIVRGSSRDNGAQALVNLKQKLEQGFSVGFGIDGPIGPIHVVKPGIVFLSQKCQVHIVPVGSAFSRYWIFARAWDKFKLPKPFAKAVLVFGKPILIEQESDLKVACLELEQRLTELQQEAEKLVK